MNILGIMGSPRKGQATDRLLDAALAGCAETVPEAAVRKVVLGDLAIHPCRNCLRCRESPATPYAPCQQNDDMSALYPVLAETDALLVATPVHMGTVTSLTLCFLERICWTFAAPRGRIFTVRGCPVPRSPKPRAAAVIVVSGVVPPLYRRFCDDATPLIRCTLKDSLNCRMAGDLYAGAIERRGIGAYQEKAKALGRKLAVATGRLPGPGQD